MRDEIPDGWTTLFRKVNVFLAIVFCLGAAQSACAQSLDGAALVGSWDYTSYTLIENGKPSGTVQFKPRSMLFTYRADRTWQMEASDLTHTRLSGGYELHGSELIMKKADGSLYQDFMVGLLRDGQEMTLKDKRSIITAIKATTAP